MQLNSLELHIGKNEICGHGIGVEGAAKLGEELSKLENLTSLNLDISENEIGDEGVEKLVRGL